MAKKKFRKLLVNLPQHTYYRQQPWLIAGLVAVFIIFAFAVYCYLQAN